MNRLDLDEDASHPRLTHLVLVLPEVPLCHPVYVLLRSVEDCLADAPTDYGYVLGLVGSQMWSAIVGLMTTFLVLAPDVDFAWRRVKSGDSPLSLRYE